MNHPDLKLRLTPSRKTCHVFAKHLIGTLRLSVHTLKASKRMCVLSYWLVWVRVIMFYWTECSFVHEIWQLWSFKTWFERCPCYLFSVSGVRNVCITELLKAEVCNFCTTSKIIMSVFTHNEVFPNSLPLFSQTDSPTTMSVLLWC